MYKEGQIIRVIDSLYPNSLPNGALVKVINYSHDRDRLKFTALVPIKDNLQHSDYFNDKGVEWRTNRFTAL
jgi:hypothetical protein